MPTPLLSRPLHSALKLGLARGLVPFDWVALHARGDLRCARRPDHQPRTFSEKVRYKIARDRRPITRIYADKVAVRDYVRSLCPDLRLPTLHAICDSAADVLRHVPEPPWVMKASHGSAMVLLCPHRGAIPAEKILRCAHAWLRTDYALMYWEWHYLRLPRRLMFEEYLGGGAGAPDDFKFYVIHRRVVFIEVDQGRFERHTRDFFRPDWTPIESRIGPVPRAVVPPPKPAQLGQMIAFAEALSCDTDFLRVDLYLVDGQIYFGELTHSPAAGNFGFADSSLDEQIGQTWQVPPEY